MLFEERAPRTFFVICLALERAKHSETECFQSFRRVILNSWVNLCLGPDKAIKCEFTHRGVCLHI